MLLLPTRRGSRWGPDSRSFYGNGAERDIPGLALTRLVSPGQRGSLERGALPIWSDNETGPWTPGPGYYHNCNIRIEQLVQARSWWSILSCSCKLSVCIGSVRFWNTLKRNDDFSCFISWWNIFFPHFPSMTCCTHFLKGKESFCDFTIIICSSHLEFRFLVPIL